MNAKVKLIAALAAVQLVVPAVFAQPRTVIVPRETVVVPAPGPVSVPSVFYEVTGRIVELTPNRIVVRSWSPERRDWVLVRREDTRFWNSVRVGDTVAIKYAMIASEVSRVETLVPPRHRH